MNLGRPPVVSQTEWDAARAAVTEREVCRDCHESAWRRPSAHADGAG